MALIGSKSVLAIMRASNQSGPRSEPRAPGSPTARPRTAPRTRPATRVRIRGATAPLLLLILAVAARAQDAQPGPAPAAQDPAALAAAQARFEALDVRKQANAVRLFERQLEWSEDAAVSRIAALRYEFDELPPAPGTTPTYGDPVTDADAPYRAAQGGGPRTALSRDSAAYAAVAARFARVPFLPDLRREVEYDWHAGRVVRREPLGYADVFANALAGYAPGSDHAVARVLDVLDDDEAQRRLGAWFAHTYCDLDAHAYPGITLYDVWYSGKPVDVPDVDAVPFGWLVLGEKKHVSPLRGKPRDRLYEAIKQAALRHRVHRTMLEAAAGACIAAEPRMDPLYALLVPRFHYLFAQSGDRLEALVERLAVQDREAVIAAVDGAIRDRDGAAWKTREARKEELRTMALRVQQAALAALARVASD